MQVKVHGFLSSKIYPKAGVSQGSVLSPLLFLSYVNDKPDPKHHQNSKSQSVDDTGLWAKSIKATVAANRLQEDLDTLPEWFEKWSIKLNPGKTKLITFFRSLNKPYLFLYGAQPWYFGDLRVIENAKLRELVAKGPKYREPNRVNWKATETMFLESIDLYAKNWS